MKKIPFITLILFFQTMVGQDLPQVIPPSPQTQEFEKFINFDVSLYNGLAEISIPLYSIQLNGVEIPVSLSYHASGIKKGQTDGEVGVGWFFNPGYRISRTVYGHPDEGAPMPTDFATKLFSFSSEMERDQYLSRFLSETNPSSQPSLAYSLRLDGEFDQFYFSLPTESGSFIISDRTTKEIATISKSNVQIDYSVNDSLTSLKATDEMGTEYFFGHQYNSSYQNVFETSSRLGGRIKTSWALTDLVTALGEKVHFDYKMGASGGWASHVKNFTFIEALDEYEDVSSSYHWTDGMDNSTSTFYLDEITSSKEKLSISRDEGDYITRIDIKTIADEPLKSIEFYYSREGHTFLDSLKVSDKNGHEVKTYKFEYYSKGVLPHNMSHDQWGYYLNGGFSGSANSHLYHEEFFDDPLVMNFNNPLDPFSDVQPLSYIFDERVDRNSLTKTGIPNHYSLKKIVYPTGGSTEYFYENNQFLDYQENIQYGGGIRIKRIEKYDNDNTTELVRSYKYGINESGNGKQVLPISHELFTNEGVSFSTFSSYVRAQRRITYSTTLQGDVDPGGFISSNVLYPEVSEYILSNTGGVEIDAGKIVYEYNLGYSYTSGALYPPTLPAPLDPVSFQYYPLSPLYVRQYLTWKRPTLSKKTYFSRDKYTGVLDSLFIEEYLYNSSVQTHIGLKVRPFASANGYHAQMPDYYQFISSFFNYDQYAVTSGISRLIEKKERWLNGNGPSLTSTVFDYNQLGKIVAETSLDSKNNEVKKVYKYPTEMVLDGNDPDGVYAGMVSRNILSPVIENLTLYNNGQTHLVKSNYSDFGAFFLPSSIETVKGESLSTNPNSTRLIYHHYDSAGNPIEISTPEGIHIVYLWGYNDKFPIAKIENSTAVEVAEALGLPPLAEELNAIDEDDLNAINQLRIILPKAFITTLTYHPLIGIKSITDARGEQSLFEYDDFNRLKFKKDGNNFILEEYQYNYEN